MVCKKDLRDFPSTGETLGFQKEGQTGEGNYILGEPKINPYTVTNMQQALINLNDQGVLPPESFTIKTTQYYVKFKPNNEVQFDYLYSDSLLDLSFLPIEANIIQFGDDYHDPSVPDSMPTPQYTAVPLNYHFNDTIPYEIISTLYIPELDTAFFNENGENQSFMDKLLDQAYIQTGNFEDTVKYD